MQTSIVIALWLMLSVSAHCQDKGENLISFFTFLFIEELDGTIIERKHEELFSVIIIRLPDYYTLDLVKAKLKEFNKEHNYPAQTTKEWELDTELLEGRAKETYYKQLIIRKRYLDLSYRNDNLMIFAYQFSADPE